MGESTVLAHAILTIVAMSLAATFATALIFRTYDVNNVFSELISVKTVNIRTEIVVSYIDESVVNTTSTSYYKYSIFMKNVGRENIIGLENADLYLGTFRGELRLYTYNSTGGIGYWNYTEYGDNDGVWEPGETIVVYAYSDYKIESPIEVRFALPSGVIVKEVSPIT